MTQQQGTPAIPNPIEAPFPVNGEVPHGAHYEFGPGHTVNVYTSDHPEAGGNVRDAAQALHTRVYLQQGFISETDLVEGLYQDEYSQNGRSTYYYVQNGVKDAVARQVAAERSEGLASLPTVEKFSCDPEIVKEVAQVKSFADLDPSEVVEISALSAERKDGEVVDNLQTNLEAVPFLYGQMLRDSIEKGHKLWITNMEEPLIDAISAMTGSEQIRRVGEPKEYMGPATTPVAINPQTTVEAILESDEKHMETYQKWLKGIFDGVDVSKAPRSFRKLLEANEIDTVRENPVKRYIKNKKALAATAIGGYSLLRALPAGTVDEFEGSTPALWAIDVGTAAPYTYGLIKMYTGKNLGEKALGAALAVPSFLAPYAYYYAEGREYPTEVNAIAGGLVLGAIAQEVWSRRRQKRIDREVSEQLLSS